MINFSLEDWPVIYKLKQARVVENLTLDNIRGILRKGEAGSFKKLEEKNSGIRESLPSLCLFLKALVKIQ